ncbi:(2Fe-2S)-binding protein [Streptomyces sp. NPDC017529]|uniref:(2Fe-2S)-binding protein n=1 Tax=Streptomyces sp. NPDC017529 TaxID=3365000 RepID=UPI0037972625
MVTTETLARISAIGPYFAVSCGPRPDATRFRPLAGLYQERALLSERVTEVGQRIGTGRRRVAASTFHLGTAARLWSVALAGAALTGQVPDLDPEGLWWRAPESGPIDLWMPEAAATVGGDTADAVHTAVVVRNLLPLGAALERNYGLSPLVMRGNVASALVGTVRVLQSCAPDLPHPPLALATALLGREPLKDAGVLTTRPLAYRRHSCCLYYRVPGGGLCGDCVLHRAKRRT